MSPAELADLAELEAAIDALPSRIADTLTPVVKRLIAEAVAAERERIIQIIDGGSFLHPQSPTRLWANSLIKAIRDGDGS